MSGNRHGAGGSRRDRLAVARHRNDRRLTLDALGSTPHRIGAGPLVADVVIARLGQYAAVQAPQVRRRMRSRRRCPVH
jgi:hypothetical protein